MTSKTTYIVGVRDRLTGRWIGGYCKPCYEDAHHCTDNPQTDGELIACCTLQDARLIAAAPDLLAAAEIGLRNELLRSSLSECAAREQDRSRMTVEAIQINRTNAKAYRVEIQENCRRIRAAIARAEGR